VRIGPLGGEQLCSSFFPWIFGWQRNLGKLNKGSIPLIISTFVERIFYRIFYLFISYKSTNFNGRSYLTIQPNKWFKLKPNCMLVYETILSTRNAWMPNGGAKWWSGLVGEVREKVTHLKRAHRLLDLYACYYYNWMMWGIYISNGWYFHDSSPTFWFPSFFPKYGIKTLII
jgi:hypothetical protein